MFWSVCNSLTREELLSPGAVCRAVCLQLEIERERRIVQPAYSQRWCTRECKKQTWLSRTWLDTCWYLQTQKIYCMDRRRISWVSSACICFCCALSPILVHFDLSSMWKKRKRQTEKRNKRKEAALEGASSECGWSTDQLVFCLETLFVLSFIPSVDGSILFWSHCNWSWRCH